MKVQKIPEPTPPPPRVWTSLDLINWTKDFFQRKGIDSPRLEAELLLAHVLGVPRIRLYADFEKPVPQEKLATYREFVKRRGETREPLAYIIGSAQFIDLTLKVSNAVLIPRPETEELAVWAVERLQEIPPERSSVHALDLCTGSGCLALYIASKEPRAKVAATDISREALDIAKENAAALKLSDRVEFTQGDLFEALLREHAGGFDLITANPPYIDPATKDSLMPEVREHEPAGALFANEAGLAVAKRILNAAAVWLRPGGWLGLEFGVNQAEALEAAAKAGGFAHVEIKFDAAKRPRFVLARTAK
ncbi:MAG TPA: peptide chain release factor N(5)-glutamine methyltransferase [Planctomycetota bacterium]|nr:peptide chain release factor N(5)-glutamine methyltransferase [Planctomycetota bacterium]